jgi:hypothetical protein
VTEVWALQQSLKLQSTSHGDTDGKRDCFVQVLRLLSQAYLLNDQAAPALQCLQNIRKLEDPLAGSPGVLLIAIQALSQVTYHHCPSSLRLHTKAALPQCAPSALCTSAQLTRVSDESHPFCTKSF